MKNNPFSCSLIVTVICCSLFWVSPVCAQTDKDEAGKVTVQPSKLFQHAELNANDQGENQLIQELLNDHMIDEIKGFLVERKQDKLYIDGQEQPAEISNKYLSAIKQDFIRVQVYSFMERLKMHPDADILQLIAPVSFSSPCVASSAKKPGC